MWCGREIFLSLWREFMFLELSSLRWIGIEINSTGMRKKWREFHYTRYVSNLKLMNFIPSQMTSSDDAASGNFIVRSGMSRTGGWRIDGTRAKSWCELFGRMKLSRSFFLAKSFPSDWSASQTHASTLSHGKYMPAKGIENSWHGKQIWNGCCSFVIRESFFYERSVSFGGFCFTLWKISKQK